MGDVPTQCSLSPSLIFLTHTHSVRLGLEAISAESKAAALHVFS